jgi:AcrR family transcriptional regulator
MPRNAEITQQRLIDTAADVIAIFGIAGLRVDHVADRAKVNKRMIYHYFGNKEGLTTRVLEQQVQCLCMGLPGMSQDLATFLRRALAPNVPQSDLPQADAWQMSRAAKVVLRGFLDGYATAGHLPDSQWHKLFTLLLRLALPETLDNPTKSERSLTSTSKHRVAEQAKPRFQLRPGFRPE